MKKQSKFNFIKDNSTLILLGIVFTLVLAIIYVYFLKTENTIRTWDYSGYWLITVYQKLSWHTANILESIKHIFITINKDDYNLLPSTLLQPVFGLSNNSFFGYIMSVFIVYLVPLLITFSFIFLKLFKKLKYRTLSYILFMFMIVLSPQLHIPVFCGYLDVVGLLICAFIMYHILDYDFEKFEFKKNILIALGLFLLTIIRRYFIFWTIGLFVSLEVVYIVKDLIINKNMKLIVNRTKNIIILGLSFSIPVILLFTEMFLRSTGTNYKVIYSAYKNGNLFWLFKNLFSYNGIVLMLLFITGFILMIKKQEYRKNAIIILLNCVITFILFGSIQGIGRHQYYVLLFSVLFFVTAAAVLILEELSVNKKLKKHKVIQNSFIVLFTIFVIMFSYKNFTIIFSKETDFLYTNSKITMYSSTKSNISNTMTKIKDILKDNDKKIYVVASSEAYNAETFPNSILPDLILKDRFTSVSNVDLRDGFDKNFLLADYILIVTPTQYHLRPENQRVVGVLYDAIENKTPLNNNLNLVFYDKIENENIEFKIYEKVKNFTKEDQKFLTEEFNKYYPQNKELFHNRILDNE